MTTDLDPFIKLESSTSSADGDSPLPLLPSRQLSPGQSPILADSPSASLMVEKPATPPKQLLFTSPTANSDAPWQGADSNTDHSTQPATLGSFVLVQATSETSPAPPSSQRSSSSTQESYLNERMAGGIMLGYARGNGRSFWLGDYSLQDDDSRAPSSLDNSTHAVSVVESNSGGDHQADTFSQCSTRVSTQHDRDNGDNHGLVFNSESVGHLVPTPGLAPAGPENASFPSSLPPALREGSTGQKQDPDVLAISRSSSYGWVEAIEQSG
ncbi:hypothetical protein EV715DRAFT_276117 [Schizophyllum commune]